MSEQQTTETELIAAIRQAYDQSSAIAIVGGDSKGFLGNPVPASSLSLCSHTGIIAYEPSELYITARAGTTLDELESYMAANNQMLAFEPPNFTGKATVGGMVASGLSGPRRPFSGSVRDYVLGLRCINGKGEVLNFGGQVIKNVAGYDVSRLMTGSYGTLGVITEVTLRVAPKPLYETAISIPMKFEQAITQIHQAIDQSIPISAATYDQQRLLLRLSGRESTVSAAYKKLSNDGSRALDLDYWERLKNHHLEFFQSSGQSIWRLSLPANTPALELTGEWLIDWAGAQRWLKSNLDAETIRKTVEDQGGHATLYYSNSEVTDRFHPLSSSVKKIHQAIKRAFDPKGILNPGRMYTDI